MLPHVQRHTHGLTRVQRDIAGAGWSFGASGLRRSRALKVVEGTEKAFLTQDQLKEVTQGFCLHEPPLGCPQQRPEAHVLIDKAPSLTLANFMVT